MLFIGCIVVLMKGISRRAQQIAALLLAATAGSAVTAAIAYRGSFSGEQRGFWLAILFYGLFVLVALRIVDMTVRRVARSLRSGARGTVV